MKYLTLLAVGIFVYSCNAVDKVETITLSDITTNKTSYNLKHISLVGYLFKLQSEATVLYGENSDSYIDVVFIGEESFDLANLKKEKKYCVLVKGIFREYNKDFIGLGNLTSKYGIIEAREISYCNNK